MGDSVDLFPSLLYMGWQPSRPSLRTSRNSLSACWEGFWHLLGCRERAKSVFFG
jgi:hypothetical protein